MNVGDSLDPGRGGGVAPSNTQAPRAPAGSLNRQCRGLGLLAGLAVLLAGCVTTAPPAQFTLEPEPDYKTLIADNLATLFQNVASVSALTVSPPGLTVFSGQAAWRVCLRANVTGVTGASIGTRVFVVYIRNRKILDRRAAAETDKCDGEKYEPLPPAKPRT